MKPFNVADNFSNIPVGTDALSRHTEYNEILENVDDPTDACDGQNEESYLFENQAIRLSEPLNGELEQLIETQRRRVPMFETEKELTNYLKMKNKNLFKSATAELADESFNPIRYFLLSLQPDIESMSLEQQRKFKIKVLMLLDEMKCSTPH